MCVIAITGTVQGDPEREEDEDSREGDASDVARGEPRQDGLQSGLTSPQGQRKGSTGRARREPASRGAVPSRPVRQIGGINPQRSSRGSRNASHVPRRKRKEQRERVKQDSTSRLAASLRSNSRDAQREGEAMAAEGVDLDDREWASAGGFNSGCGSVGGSQRSVA